MPEPLVSMNNVARTYDVGRAGFWGLGERRSLKALDEVTLDINEGEIVGLVGESGSGKSTLGRLIVGLEKPTRGEIHFSREAQTHSVVEGADFGAQMVFQNPSGSLNPRQKVWDIIAEPLLVYRSLVDVKDRVEALMQQVGLPAEFARRHPYEMSGGQAQRVGIARALALDPRLIVCDEPISALDVSIQAQILNLLTEIQERTKCSYLFISHDLPVVQRMSHRIAIMYLGRIVETATAAELFANPHHPYTKTLMESAPRLEAAKRDFKPVAGEIPSPLNPPTGCHFHPRCPFVMDRCRVEQPKLRTVAAGHVSACHLDDEDCGSEASAV